MDELKQRNVEYTNKELQGRSKFTYEGNIFHDYFRKISFAKRTNRVKRDL